MKLPLHAITHARQAESLKRELIRERDRNNKDLGFGSPNNQDNIRGTWVTLVFDNHGQTQTATHSLDINATVAATPNVGWIVFGIKHNGTGAPALGVAGGDISLIYEGGTVTNNSIQLVIRASATRTINAGNPVTMIVFFIPYGENW